MLLEPDVALTDFGLALEGGGLAVWLLRGEADRRLQRWFATFFVALGVGALFGGVTHGFLADDQSLAYRAMWSSTLLAIGAAAFSGCIIGGYLIFSERGAKRLMAIAGFLLAVYAATVLYFSQSFAVAVAFYLPAALFLLASFVIKYWEKRDAYLVPGIAGLALSFVAAAIQQTETGIPSLSLGHNALYHLVQASALLLIFWTARGLTRGIR